MHLTDIAINDLRRRKAKMAFVVIGMVIGIATIVAMFTITRAMEKEIADKFDQIGANMTIVPRSDGLSLSYGGVPVSDLSFDVKELDMSAIPKIRSIKNKENIANIAPKLLGTMAVQGKDILVVGIDFPSELRMKKWWKIQGTKPEKENDILLGAEKARVLGKKPGETVNIMGKDFRVAGVLEEMGSQEDKVIYMNLKTTQQLLGKGNALSFIEISALCSTCPIQEIIKQVNEKLPDAKVTAVKEVIEARKNIVDRFSNLAMGVSVIVLLIGSFIVLITMMSSVNERTREIGIFRAIGFRKSHIITMILLEALILSLVGGVFGFLLGMGAAKVAAPVIAQMDVNILWDPGIGAGALALAVVVGLLASLLPAVHASKLDPVEALRFI